jgi:hypothetical protein
MSNGPILIESLSYPNVPEEQVREHIFKINMFLTLFLTLRG